MNEEKLKSALFEELAKCGYQCKIIASDHINDLQSEIENQFTTNARENFPTGYRLRGITVWSGVCIAKKHVR
ncbi:MAG: hypothetical protein PVH85_19575 [Desulfobacterales bacterium]|jgi:hypothetical protein